MPDFTVPVIVPSEQQTVVIPASTVVVPESTQVVNTTARTLTATLTVDMTNVKTLLRLAGWAEAQLDLGQAIVQAESQCYSDAVGDVSLTSEKWGPSIGLFQIRSLRSPQSFGGVDLWRYAWPLRQPFYNAQAALAITKGGTDFSAWSVFTSGSYKPYLGQDPTIRTGYSAAANWWK
jgi:hypothetical protein